MFFTSTTSDTTQLNFQTEFITGSAIAAPLFRQSIALVTDTEVLPGGEVSYRIAEALNWNITRFGNKSRIHQEAALFLNEDGSTWQAKLTDPKMDSKKGKPRKYETPIGNGSRAFFPNLDSETRQRIQSHSDILVPPQSSVWDWLRLRPELPIVLTEGGKKSLSLLTQGYLGIALYGVNGGYRTKDALGEICAPSLIADLVPFIQPGRQP